MLRINPLKTMQDVGDKSGLIVFKRIYYYNTYLYLTAFVYTVIQYLSLRKIYAS